MPDFFFFINEVLWGSIMIYLLLAAGIWFTLRSGFIQFRYIRKFGRSLKNSVTPQPGGLTSFGRCAPALRQGLAAVTGGGRAGYQRRWAGGGFLDVGDGNYRHGNVLCRMLSRPALQRKRSSWPVSRWPSSVHGARLRDALDGRAVLTFLTRRLWPDFQHRPGKFCRPCPLRYAFACPEWLTGAGLALCILLTISTGLKGTARLMQWLVPVMALLWVAASLLVAALHIDQVPDVIATIFSSAFGWREAASGALGYTFSRR